jgi:hypothetical protein
MTRAERLRVTAQRRSPAEFLILDAMRHGRVRAQPAHLVALVILEIAFESEDVGGDAVEEPAVVADDDGAAGKSSSASSSARSVSPSRSLVGSSRRSTLAPDLSILARCTRLRSPPESCPNLLGGLTLAAPLRESEWPSHHRARPQRLETD